MANAAPAECTPHRVRVVGCVPAVLLAFAVSGFWLYLGVLDLVGVEPRTTLTGAYYAVLGAAMAGSAFHGRRILGERFRARSHVPRLWAFVSAALAGLFLLNVALVSSGTLARDAAFLLVLSSVPSAALVLALTERQLTVAAVGIVALAAGLALVDLVSLAFESTQSIRFSPINELDPISAAQVTALGAVVLLTRQVQRRRSQMVQTAVVAVLVAMTVVPGSRGAVLALLLGAVAVAAVSWRRVWPILVPALAIGLAAGTLGASLSGSDYYYSIDVPGIQGRVAPPTEGVDYQGNPTPVDAVPGQRPISTLAIRRYLLAKAIRESFDRPLVGKGVGSLVDDSPDTLRMVRAKRLAPGARTHPHNAVVESLYSLGVPGFLLFATMLATSGLALVRLLRGGTVRAVTRFALAFAAVAAVNSSLSGEIGSDADLWVALALPVALYADTRREALSR